jgi:hypothetical protein
MLIRVEFGAIYHREFANEYLQLIPEHQSYRMSHFGKILRRIGKLRNAYNQ